MNNLTFKTIVLTVWLVFGVRPRIVLSNKKLLITLKIIYENKVTIDTGFRKILYFYDFTILWIFQVTVRISEARCRYIYTVYEHVTNIALQKRRVEGGIGEGEKL